MSATVKTAGKTAGWVDDRFTSSNFLKRNIGKVFPEHWSFMLGEIALYSFIVVMLSGVYLTLFFKPSMIELAYNGSYVPLKGVKMTEAYASTLNISFDIRGGLLMRQIHHWSALFFVAAISVHLLRVFFTGAFRKPRELNWVIGVGLLTMALLAGFAGYSLPDDLLSGTGLRIAQGIVLSLPLVGTYLSFFIFGGEFPGTDFISRLYAVHILVVPGLILALLTAHLMMVWYQKHTQFPGPGRTNDNVVGYRVLPIYMAKAGGFFFVVFGVITLISGLVTINPIWLYGPYTPDQVTAGSQPDWYIGWLEGSLRMMPNVEWVIFGYTLSWNILVPAVILPGLVFTVMAIYPWIEQWATGDKREHHLLDRPRNAPVRTSLGAMAVSFYVLLWIGGGNDLIASFFDMSINTITWFLRFAIFLVPPLVFVATKRICLGLQRRDRDKLLHGMETGNILRLPHGEFIEVHAPISDEEKAVLMAKPERTPLTMPEEIDENGVAMPGARGARLRAKLSNFYYADNIPLPTREELEAAEAHLRHEVEQAAPAMEEDRRLIPAHDGSVLHDPAIDK
ncbi:MAG: ubiquinol-cytochrome c reductase cytochrome b subunit [Actinobacteria bacterium]|nr:ubiquinol-cytochrome c reductase cytochrome b subunit [Actinomycetota bacterium]MCO5300498.1 ubiquinol-cytochrome c reductase cytochrome b subunit [Candidatus Nanopelagicales bacterium]HPE13934.1 ubiquinol-cytochrome c reductase cytochrome b subunit [Actinomycetota bacterium]HPQ83379.1 ubiquinol-cytochrome c reductase cytochrome b subunit [Actinomycetota bacterium]HRV65685.1 ubiquinol-cytochrome c reductase cytochrome b subunit [Candidatus Nanopelagicales bacterium]